MAWLNFTMPNQTVKNDLKAKKFKLSQMNFFSRKINNKNLMYVPAPFILQNFWAQNGPYAPKKTFLENYYYHSHLPISPFRCVKFHISSSSGSRVMRMRNFWTQNGPFPQMVFFKKNLLISLVSFTHAYLHAKNRSQILIY